MKTAITVIGGGRVTHSIIEYNYFKKKGVCFYKNYLSRVENKLARISETLSQRQIIVGPAS